MLQEPLHSIVYNEDEDTVQAGGEIPSHLHQGRAATIPLLGII